MVSVKILPKNMFSINTSKNVFYLFYANKYAIYTFGLLHSFEFSLARSHTHVRHNVKYVFNHKAT